VVLNLTADLRSEFTWNTKQLYVFANIEFETDTNEVNQMVIWNTIIQDKARTQWLWCTNAQAQRHCGSLPAQPSHATAPPCPALPLPLTVQMEALLAVPTLRQMYPFAISDQGFGLRDREFNVTVAWNVMPKVGALYTRRRTFSGAAQGAGCGRGWVVTLGRQAARKNAPGGGCKVVP
jgi:signal peptidase complex subunit 3